MIHLCVFTAHLALKQRTIHVLYTLLLWSELFGTPSVRIRDVEVCVTGASCFGSVMFQS